MSYTIAYTARFERDYKRVLKRGWNEALIQKVIMLLVQKEKLAAKHKVHKLSGNYSDCWECHILPDWLLMWYINEKDNELVLVRTGSHSDLF